MSQFQRFQIHKPHTPEKKTPIKEKENVAPVAVKQPTPKVEEKIIKIDIEDKFK